MDNFDNNNSSLIKSKSITGIYKDRSSSINSPSYSELEHLTVSNNNEKQINSINGNDLHIYGSKATVDAVDNVHEQNTIENINNGLLIRRQQKMTSSDPEKVENSEDVENSNFSENAEKAQSFAFNLGENNLNDCLEKMGKNTTPQQQNLMESPASTSSDNSSAKKSKSTNPFLLDCSVEASVEASIIENKINNMCDAELFGFNEIAERKLSQAKSIQAFLPDNAAQINATSRKKDTLNTVNSLNSMHARVGASFSCADEYNASLIEEESDEFCKSEIFDTVDKFERCSTLTGKKHHKFDNSNRSTISLAKHKKQHRRRFSMSEESHNSNNAINSELPDNENLMNDANSIISAIPICSFQRQDYKRPDEYQPDNTQGKRLLMKDKKGKSSDLFHLPGFSKHDKLDDNLPSLKNVNLSYPNKTSGALTGHHDKKYFEKIHSKAKNQLIKLGQKCKLFHQSPVKLAGGHAKTAIIKTNTNHRKKYQYYNEINKSYHLDDFINSTNLLAEPSEQGMIEHENNNVAYKTYKSEIDLTRNLTYLDAFLNENFDREPASTKLSKSKSHGNHKRAKSCSRNINYVGNVANTSNEQEHEQTMIDYDDLNQCDARINWSQANGRHGDDNATSSSFEYKSFSKDNKDKRCKKENVPNEQGERSGKSNTTSSSLSSSDYASVYSGPTATTKMDKLGEITTVSKAKLITTPEESQEYFEKKFTDQSPQRNKKHKIRKHSLQSAEPVSLSSPFHRPDIDFNGIINYDGNLLLYDENNFLEIDNSIKRLHPGLYNSVPQIDDLNSIEFYENTNHIDYGEFGEFGEPSNHRARSFSNNGRRLSSSYNNDHEDYLEHFNMQQQIINGSHNHKVDGLQGAIERTSNGYGSRSMTSAQSAVYNQQIRMKFKAGVDECYNNRKYSTSNLPATTPTSYGPHRVIVSKSKKQKGELVLEYEC